VELRLRTNEILNLDLRNSSCRLSCQGGRLWVTITGDDRDYLLQSGSSHEFPAGGSLVVEAWEDAALVVQQSAFAPVQARPVRLVPVAH